MRVLPDTQIAIWALTDTRRLSERAKTLIADYTNDVFVSAVSVWEIAIKFALGKRASTPPFPGEVALNAFLAAGFQMLRLRCDMPPASMVCRRCTGIPSTGC